MTIDELTKKLRDAVAAVVPFDPAALDMKAGIAYFTFIQLCTPDNITLLLDTIDKLNGKLAEYRAQELKAQEINLALEKKLEIVRRDALMEAAKAICISCYAGDPIVVKDKCYISNYGDHWGGHVHYPVEDSNGGYADCTAAPIRALIDKPVEER